MPGRSLRDDDKGAGGGRSLRDERDRTKAADPGEPAPSTLQKIGRGLKDAVTGIPKGLATIAQQQWDSADERMAAVARAQAAPGLLVTEGPEGAARAVLGARPGEDLGAAFQRVDPFTADMVASLGRSSRRATSIPAEVVPSLAPGGLRPSETRLGQDYNADPVGSFLEDASNAALVLGPAAKGAGAVASKSSATAARLAAEGAEGAGAASLRASRLAKVAKTTERAARVTEKVADSPTIPFRVAARGAGRGLAAVDRAASRTDLARRLRLDQDSRALRRDVLNPAQEEISDLVGRQVRLGQEQADLVPNPVEQQALYVVGEGQAQALAAVRRAAPDRFDGFVTDTFGDSLDPKAAAAAADYADGTLDDTVRARIDEALRVGRESDGGRLARRELYESEGGPSRAEQAGFRPLTRVVDDAVKPIEGRIGRAQRMADAARRRATQAEQRTLDRRADLSARLEEMAFDKGDMDHRRSLKAAIREAETSGDRLSAAKVTHAADQYAAARKAANDDAVAIATHRRAMEEAAAGVDDAKRRAEIADWELQALKGSADRSIAAGRAVGKAEQKVRALAAVVRSAEARVARLEAKGPKAARVAPTFEMGRQLERAEQKAKVQANLARSAETRVAALRTKAERARANAESSIDAAPARLRPALKTNRQAVKTLTDVENTARRNGDTATADLASKAAAEIPTTLAALEAAGVDPDHFIHVRVGDKPLGGTAPDASRLPRLRKTRAEKQRLDSQRFDRSVRAQTQAELDEFTMAVKRQAADKIREMPFAARLGDGPLADARTAADAEAAGYVAWNPKTLFEKQSTVRRLDDIDAALGVTGDDIFIPKHLFEGFRTYFNDPTWDRVLQATYDPAIRAFKTVVLPLSPSWNIGNAIGNVFMGTVGAGVDPATFAASAVKAVREYRKSGPAGRREFAGPRRLYTAGPSYNELEFLRGDQVVEGGRLAKAVHKAGAPARLGYRINQFVDDVGRTAVWMAKGGDDKAMREALKMMGDFSKMTPFERRVIRRVVPFYAWQRHITTLAFRLPVEHPVRVAWTLHLADLYGQPDESLPEYLRGAVELPGGTLLNTANLHPFAGVGDFSTFGLSPAIKLAVNNDLPGPLSTLESGRGINPSTGRPYSRPPGSGDVDEFGNPLPTAPSIVKQVTDIAPQKRLYEGLTGRNQIARYDTGDPVIVKGRTLRNNKTPGQAVASALGIRLVDADSARQQQARAEEKQAEQRKRLADYERKRRASAQ